MNNNQQTGMRYPSIDQLADKTSSKYRLVMAVAKRALQIDETKQTYMEHPSNKKSIGLALEEIKADKILIR